MTNTRPLTPGSQRLSDEQRVRTVRCPKCNAIFSVVEPVRDEGVAIKDDPSLPSPGPPAKGQVERRSSREPATSQSSADLAWELKIADGRVFGPVDRPTLDQWIREGYVGIDCWLRRSTNREWQPRMATGLKCPSVFANHGITVCRKGGLTSYYASGRRDLLLRSGLHGKAPRHSHFCSELF